MGGINFVDTIVAHKGELVGAVYISAGSACLADNKGLTVEALYQQADKMMYEDKSAILQTKRP